MGFSFKTPPHILFERGSAAQLGKLVSDRMKRPVFVTDQGVIAAGLVEGALESLGHGLSSAPSTRAGTVGDRDCQRPENGIFVKALSATHFHFRHPRAASRVQRCSRRPARSSARH